MTLPTNIKTSDTKIENHLDRENTVMAEEERLRAEISRLTAEANRLTVESTRLQVECTNLRTENTSLKTEVSTLTSENTRLTAEVARLKPTLVINERVGSVSAEYLFNLSEEEKRRLDCALTRIVARGCFSGLSWQQIAPIIRDGLAEVGLNFRTKASFHDDANGDWTRANHVGFSDLKRVGFAVDSSRHVSGDHWYPDEMFRVLKKLMELRGFQV